MEHSLSRLTSRTILKRTPDLSCLLRTQKARQQILVLKKKGRPIMLVNMSPSATKEEINHVIERIRECGFQAHVIEGAERTVIGAVGNSSHRSEVMALRAASGVEDVIQI